MLATEPVVTVSLRFAAPAAAEVKRNNRGVRWASRAPASAIRSTFSSRRSRLVSAWSASGTTPRSSTGWPDRAPTRRQRRSETRICTPLGSCLSGSVGPLGAQVLVRDHVRATGAGVGVDPEHRADLVVLEARREDVAGAVALRVGHQDDRPLVDLPDVVDDVGGIQRERGGVGRPGGHRLLQRCLPVLIVGNRRGKSGGAGRAHELERLRRDPPRAEELQQELRRDHVAAAVASDVEHQSLRRHHREQPGELVEEGVDVLVLHVEGEDPEVPEGATGRVDDPRLELVGAVGRDGPGRERCVQAWLAGAGGRGLGQCLRA